MIRKIAGWSIFAVFLIVPFALSTIEHGWLYALLRLALGAVGAVIGVAAALLAYHLIWGKRGTRGKP